MRRLRGTSNSSGSANLGSKQNEKENALGKLNSVVERKKRKGTSGLCTVFTPLSLFKCRCFSSLFRTRAVSSSFQIFFRHYSPSPILFCANLSTKEKRASKGLFCGINLLVRRLLRNESRKHQPWILKKGRKKLYPQEDTQTNLKKAKTF